MSFLPKRTVVVPVDFAEESVNAVSTALELAEKPADVHVVHVVLPPQNMSPAVLWSEVINEPHDNRAKKFLSGFVKKHGFVGVTEAVEEGDPGLEICDYAKKHQADLIVISSHGYHGVKRMLLGSTTERVIRHAGCAVLVMRRTDAD